MRHVEAWRYVESVLPAEARNARATGVDGWTESLKDLEWANLHHFQSTHQEGGNSNDVAVDGLNAVTVVSQRVDRKHGSGYAKRTEAYRVQLQKSDVACAMGIANLTGAYSGSGVMPGSPVEAVGCL